MPTTDEFFSMKLAILDDINFDELILVMKTINWKLYIDKQEKVPNQVDLHSKVNLLLNAVIEKAEHIRDDSFVTINSGGLIGTYYGKKFENPVLADTLNLTFQFMSSSASAKDVVKDYMNNSNDAIIKKIDKMETTIEHLVKYLAEEQNIVRDLKNAVLMIQKQNQNVS